MSEAAEELVEEININPQEGPQTAFLESEADIVIYGGAAGGGKTYGLLIEDFRHCDNPGFGSVTFRRNSTQITKEGGLWDESMRLYPLVDGHPREHRLEWRFPSGARASFSHLEYEKDVLNWQGTAIALLKFDELTHFTRYQFFYMLTRNRSICGVKPYVRATTNPDPDSWVKEFISWWLDDNGEYPREDRAGKLRWFIVLNDVVIWRDTKDQIHQQYGYGTEIQPKSVTFIPSKLQDNKILMEKDPGYHANLLAQDRVTRARLLEGNWKVRPSAGMLFRREWFPIIDAVPAGWTRSIRFWDRAATKPNPQNPDPDWTRGLKLYKYPNGKYVVVDLKSMRDTPAKVENLICNTASHDTTSVEIASQTDPGSAGKKEAEVFIAMLAGYAVRSTPNSKDKVTRAKPVSAQAEVGNIQVLRAAWNEEFFTELENFPEGVHDDIVDVLSGGFNELTGGLSIADAL
jgi:predicted phage terminase large subunit-like protein